MKAKPREVGAFDAKNRFSELLARVDEGAEFTIAKRGRAVARLIPAVSHSAEARAAATVELRALRERYSLNGLSVRKLINEGRP